MSLPSIAAIPLLKPGITITPYQDDVASATPRFLLALGDSYFLVSEKARALVLALLRTPANDGELEAGFEAETGLRVPASQLLAMAGKTLPPALFHDAPDAPRELPFIVSLTLLGPRLAARATACLSWMFAPALALPLLALFATLHVFALPMAMHQGSATFSASDGVLLACLYMLSGLIHELGHTAACRYFKCPHGGIGFGLYYIFPAWYADVTQAWRLSGRQRAVVDLGGVYFQSVFLIGVDAWAIATGDALALKLVFIITFTMLFTLNPVFKFDGYWLLSDLSGLHNLHQQVRRSTAALIATMLGKRPAATPSLRGGILYAYTVLSTCYMVYFAYFLFTQIDRLSHSLPASVARQWALVGRAFAEPGWGVVVALAQFAGTLLWPLIILLGCIFFADKLRRSITDMVGTVRQARATPAGADFAAEKT
jgi:putative peptide zinc metalloprotease protein